MKPRLISANSLKGELQSVSDTATISRLREQLKASESSKAKRLAIDKIVDEINRRMGDNRTPVITRGAMGTERSGKGWKMKAERHSPNYTTNWQELPVVKL